MKKTFYLLLLFTFYTNTKLFSQNTIYKGNEQYPATSPWEFKLNGDYWKSSMKGSGPRITIAKHSNGGFFMLSIETPRSSSYIGGNVTIFLSNGVTITCYDKGIRDYVDNKSIALYNLTNSEIEAMKIHQITKIRFSIMNQPFPTENFTADNKCEVEEIRIGGFGGSSIYTKGYYETNLGITALFE